MKKRLLMISYPFPPNATAGAVRSERFARYLGQFGWDVDVVTIKPRKGLYQDTSRLKSLGHHVDVRFTSTLDPWLWLRRKAPKNIILRAFRSLAMRLFSFPDHMLLWIPFAVQEGLKIFREKRVDAIYTTSPPHSTHLAGLIINFLTKVPWVADFRDPWTLNKYRRRGIIENYSLYFEHFLEVKVIRNASIVLVNTTENRRNLLKAYPWIRHDKVIHLSNGWEEFTTKEEFKNKNTRSITIVHAGTFYPRFQPYALLYAISLWRKGVKPKEVSDFDENIKIILLGARDKETKKIIMELGIEDLVDIKSWVALKDARAVMAKADLLWVSLGTNQESSSFLPSKIFEYFAAKKFIVGFFPAGEAYKIIINTNTGVVFTNNEPFPVIKFLEEIQHQKNSSGISYLPNEKVLEQYHIKNIVKKLSFILNHIGE